MEVCTIIAKNYVAHARVLARSLAEHQPGARLWTLIVDDFSRYIDPSNEPFEVLTPADIACTPFTHMAMRYSVLELSTAVKPWLLRHLLETTGGPVTYLDPDIKVYKALDALERAAAEHGVALIPHTEKPVPADGKRPSQVDIMIAGVYNLGFVSVARRPEVDALLDWWADRLERDCRVDPVWGYFVDQRWFDLAPGFLEDVAIIRDPQYNVAYWNLHSRRLGLSDGEYTVDGRPLAFFHFSGFDPDRPDELSKHQNRIVATQQPFLPRILDEYAADLRAVGHRVSRAWPYSYRALADGTHIDDTVRALYDEYAGEHAAQVPSPFTLAGARQFERWWATQAPAAAPGINRALAHVHAQRPDLRAMFPELTGEGGMALLEWAETAGSAENPLLARAMATPIPPTNGVAPALNRRRPRAMPEARDAELPWGVNVVGDFHSGLEGGELARQLLGALDTASIPALAVQSQTTRPGREWLDFPTVPADQAAFAVNLLVVDAEALPELAAHGGASLLGGRVCVVVSLLTASELTPMALDALTLADELWAPSAYVAELLGPLAEVPVESVVAPIEPRPVPVRPRAELELPEDEFIFLTTVDHRESLARQNPLGVAEAFAAQFDAQAGAHLVIAARNTDADRGAHADVLAAVQDQPHITILTDDASPDDASALIEAVDCVVSLHREVAFGVGLAESMARGKPVIATGYSGNLAYMTDADSLLVDHVLVPVDASDVRSPQWAEPDLAHAGRLMRAVREDSELAARVGAIAAAAIRHHRSRHAVAAGLRSHVNQAQARAARHIQAPARARPAAVGQVSLRLREGPVPRTGAVGGAARESLRKAVLRVMQPYTAYQERLNAEVLQALEALADAVDGQRSTASAERALYQAQGRRLEEMEALARRYEETLKGADMREISAGIDYIKRLLTEDSDRATYLSLAELSRRHRDIHPHPGEPPGDRGLTAHELRVYSQNGEDGVVAEILRRVGAPTRSFVEFGIESGREGNCVYLADVAGWSGLFLEADRECFDALARKYAAQSRVQTVRAMVAPDNVEELFSAAGVPSEPDVVSIDIDGTDYWVWEALDRYRPRVLIIEYNSSLDPRRRLVQAPDAPPWDGSSYYGASLGALAALGEGKGYRLVHTERSGANAFFVRGDLLGDAFAPAEDVAQRGYPNYFARGYRHPPADPTRRYLDLDSGELVEPEL